MKTTILAVARVDLPAALSAADTVVVNVLEDAAKAYFVDGDHGNDTTGDGTRDNPFVSIAHALSKVTSNDPQEIYVMARGSAAAYDESGTDLNVPAGTSLYGGGLSDETARVLDLSPATVNRELQFAKAWVYKEIQAQRAGPS